jgi:hypothetical protein
MENEIIGYAGSVKINQAKHTAQLFPFSTSLPIICHTAIFCALLKLSSTLPV